MSNLRDEFLIDPEVIFLNHGSFGACPRTVFEDYQNWQRQLERQPVEFLGRQAVDLLSGARKELAEFINVEPDDLVYFTNPTSAINMVARSLDLNPGDEILSTNHEYGAMDRTWRYICEKTGARYIQKSIHIPVSDQGEFIESFWQAVTPRTKIIFISHITSPTALIFPVEEICSRAHQAGILSIVDGAHALGHIQLDLKTIDADIYTGACHKWLCAPKGAAFLYARKDIQSKLDPLVISWGYESEKPGPSQFIDYHEWQGTRDIAAFLSVPSAIRFQLEHDWDEIHDRCHKLAREARSQIDAITGLEPISPDTQDWFGQMVAARLPMNVDPEAIKQSLYDQYQIEVLTHMWQEQPLIRVSFQAYNQRSDLDALLTALDEILN
jgi:isopenicillin-N epimerase